MPKIKLHMDGKDTWVPITNVIPNIKDRDHLHAFTITYPSGTVRDVHLYEGNALPDIAGSLASAVGSNIAAKNLIMSWLKQGAEEAAELKRAGFVEGGAILTGAGVGIYNALKAKKNAKATGYYDAAGNILITGVISTKTSIYDPT